MESLIFVCCVIYTSRLCCHLVSSCVRWPQTFHDDEWVGKIRRKKGSSVVEVTGASHWVMVDKPDIVNGRLDTFFAED